MKKILITVISVLLAGASAWAQGIGSAEELQAFIDAYNKGADILPWCNADSVVVLTADIDLSKAKKLPQVQSFGHHFDGQGHRLKNWKAQGGLFREINSKGVVEGIIIDASCSMKVTSKGDEYRFGYIADYNDGFILNCVNCGSVAHKCTFALAPLYIGGIAGYNHNVIYKCRNEGAISSDVLGEAKQETCLSVGGITGGAVGKAPNDSQITRCENTGDISVVSNLVSLFVGGIAGNANRAKVKLCVNRGSVTSEISESEDGKTTGITRNGGICGQTKANMARCTNYGTIKSTGACGANIGGIAGIPHESLVIAECLNYGSVIAEGDQPSQVGGIAGNIGRPVHVRGCTNYGDIRFDGVSSRSRSTAAGIVGNIYLVKTATAGTYVRECINHGNIFAGHGGNKYDANNNNAIHAAGIVGYAEGRPDILAYVMDCSNDGKISCASGRKGDIIANAVQVQTGGEAHRNLATETKPLPDGSNIWGTVKTPDGKPIEGIVVTDGLHCKKTDAEGRFAFQSDLETTDFVYVSMPAWVSITTRESIPQFFFRIPRNIEAAEANFTLELREPVKDYTVMMIADPQVRPFGWDNSMERWGDTVAPDAEAFRQSCPGEVYSINLGDLVYNEMPAWDDYLDIAALIQCPTFNVIGNHDYDQGNLFETCLGDVFYKTYVGPTHYSFDLGDIHYIVFNDILYDRQNSSESYHYGLDDETFNWLKEDLSFVPKDKILITCSHNNPFKTPNKSPHGSHNAYSLHYAEYLALLSSYREVYAWNGHNHQNFYYNYEGKTTPHGAPNIQCISVARATGALRFNAPIGPFGDPQGYMVMNVHGEQIDWYYKSVGAGADYQMRAYSPERTQDGSVKVTVWNWSEGWSMPAWYENGEKVADMELVSGVDPDYYDLFETVSNQTTRKYCTPSKESWIFRTMPSPGVTSGEVRVTDLFGKTYTQSISW